jgi:hypothetical protein
MRHGAGSLPRPVGVQPAVRGASRPRRNSPAGDVFAPACLTPCQIPVTCGRGVTEG